MNIWRTMSTTHQLLQVNIFHLLPHPLRLNYPQPLQRIFANEVDLNGNFLGFDVNGKYLEVDINGNFSGTDINGNLLGDNPSDNVSPWQTFKLAMAVPDGQEAAPVNLHGQFLPVESPHNDNNTAGMPNVCNPGTPDNSFFKGGRRKYEWNFIRTTKPKCTNCWWNELVPNSCNWR